MKKWFKRIAGTLLVLVGLFSGYALISGKTYLFRAVWYNFANVDDYKIFSNDTVNTGMPEPWNLSDAYNRVAYPEQLDQLMARLQSIGLVVVRNDSLLFEKYWEGYSDSSWSGSFSMAKSITSLLVGAALREGAIHSLQDPVGNYLPEFSTGDKAKLKIVHLLTMSSGTDWNESYANPFSVTTEAYYGSNLYKTATGVHMVREPGTQHAYKSGDSQLLGLLLEKSTGRSLAAYAAEKLWQPLGAVHPALWSTDHEAGHQKAYCCFNSNARDFARIGQLMLDSGVYNGVRVIDSSYFVQSTQPCMIPDEQGIPCDYYGYQWWLMPAYPGVFYARGILGQYIIVIPSRNIVVVRLGKTRSATSVNGAPEEVDALIRWGMSL